jgi:ABC-2 type transport system permease protein
MFSTSIKQFSTIPLIGFVFRSQFVYLGSVWVNVLLEILGFSLVFYFWSAIQGNSFSGFEITNFMLWSRLLAPMLSTSNGLDHVGLSYFGRLARDGELSTELLRPVDFQANAFCRSLGKLAFELLLRLPLLLVGWLFFGLYAHTTMIGIFSFVITLCLGYISIFMLDWLISCLAFVTTSTWGLNMVRWGIASFCGGLLLPLVWLPHPLRDIVMYSPFALAVAQPLNFLLPNIFESPNLFSVVLWQFGWIIALTVISRLTFQAIIRRVAINGG